MSLNIKNERTHALVRELARLTGESMTDAVTTSVRERLERLRQDTGEPRMAERIHAIAVDVHDRLPADFLDVPHGSMLYDADGLPR